MTDGRGRAVSFRETVVVMTSNEGAAGGGNRRIGFGGGDGADPGPDSRYHAALARLLSPEIRGRIQKTLVFKPLGPEVLGQIARQALDELIRRLAALGVTVAADDGVIPFLLARADGEAGARGIRRALAESVEEPIGRALVSRAAPGGSVRIVADGDRLRYEWSGDRRT